MLTYRYKSRQVQDCSLTLPPRICLNLPHNRIGKVDIKPNIPDRDVTVMNVSTASTPNINTDTVCPICQDNIDKKHIDCIELKCKHALHMKCCPKLIDDSLQLKCPLCRQVSHILLFASEL